MVPPSLFFHSKWLDLDHTTWFSVPLAAVVGTCAPSPSGPQGNPCEHLWVSMTPGHLPAGGYAVGTSALWVFDTQDRTMASSTIIALGAARLRFKGDVIFIGAQVPLKPI